MKVMVASRPMKCCRSSQRRRWTTSSSIIATCAAGPPKAVKLGFTAFGGPAAHVAMMEDEVVHRRRWLDRQHFMGLLATITFIPGPNSTQLAIHLGLLRAGYPRLRVA